MMMWILAVVVLFLFCRWVWAEAGSQPDVEGALNIGGFGYPVNNPLS